MSRRYSVFDLTHEKKLTGNMGLLYPCMNVEVMPGDKFRCSSDMVLRMMPMVAPMMHRVDCFIHYFFVPTRLLWKDFDVFLTGGDDGQQVIEPPYMGGDSGGNFKIVHGDLGDYLGLPSSQAGLSVLCSALPYRAYALIFNEWYRDQSVVDKIGFDTGNGADTTTNTILQRRAWQRGYFENALPWAQKGDPVSLPIAGDAPVYSNGKAVELPIGTSAAASTGTLVVQSRLYGAGTVLHSGGVTGYNVNEGTSSTPFDTNLITKMGEGQAVTINELRLAFQVQRFLERNSRSGSRYIEFLLSHFSIRSSDARLQRPEYLGGGRCPIVVGDVLQTSQTDETPQGNMAGQGYAAMHAPGFKYRAEEYGYIIGLLSIMPKPTYMQGLHKMWSRFSRFDYPLPVFAHLGDQAIYERELWYQNQKVDGSAPNVQSDGYTAANNEVFGYAPRYEELRRIPSTVHGEFRATLDYWHLGRIFDQKPTLSKKFIECDPSDRVFAVQDGSDKFVVQLVHQMSGVRQLPKFGIPGLIDHC